MMKSLLAVAVVFASSSAFAQQIFVPRYVTPEGYTSVVCRDARQIVDAGIQAKIVQHDGAPVLEISEESFAGLRSLGSAPVTQTISQNRMGNQDVFAGQTVQLVINLDMQPENTLNDGELPAYIRGTIGTVQFDNDVKCKFFSRIR